MSDYKTSEQRLDELENLIKEILRSNPSLSEFEYYFGKSSGEKSPSTTPEKNEDSTDDSTEKIHHTTAQNIDINSNLKYTAPQTEEIPSLKKPPRTEVSLGTANTHLREPDEDDASSDAKATPHYVDLSVFDTKPLNTSEVYQASNQVETTKVEKGLNGYTAVDSSADTSLAEMLESVETSPAETLEDEPLSITKLFSIPFLIFFTLITLMAVSIIAFPNIFSSFYYVKKDVPVNIAIDLSPTSTMHPSEESSALSAESQIDLNLSNSEFVSQILEPLESSSVENSSSISISQSQPSVSSQTKAVVPSVRPQYNFIGGSANVTSKITTLRHAYHTGSERLVIDFGEGSDVPSYEGTLSPDSLKLELKFSSVGDATSRVFDSGLIKEYSVVDNLVSIDFRVPVICSIFKVGSPSRLVIDVYKK